MEQKIITADREYYELTNFIKQNNIRRILLVCDNSFGFLNIKEYIDSLEDKLGVKIIYFSDFKPNPLYESVVSGVELFNRESCDSIVAVGGGSAIDVAKCIKLYSKSDRNCNFFLQKVVPNDIILIAVPTTAGTGSEATRFAVIYYKGEKQSVSDYSCIPSIVLMDPSALKTLPVYQKKSTMMDAFCHAIEAFWSINSTDESKGYSKRAIKLILQNKDAYIANDENGNSGMLNASYIAGKAINIAQTTAGHAMCYKLTSLYNIAHGHAAALCLKRLWPYMIENADKCVDPRGFAYLNNVFAEIAASMGCSSSYEAVLLFDKIFRELELAVPKAKPEDYLILKNSVNPVRLKNNPVKLDTNTINVIYHQIFEEE